MSKCPGCRPEWLCTIVNEWLKLCVVVTSMKRLETRRISYQNRVITVYCRFMYLELYENVQAFTIQMEGHTRNHGEVCWICSCTIDKTHMAVFALATNWLWYMSEKCDARHIILSCTLTFLLCLKCSIPYKVFWQTDLPNVVQYCFQ